MPDSLPTRVSVEPVAEDSTVTRDGGSAPTADRLADLLSVWWTGRAAGAEPTPEALCPDNPPLREELRRRITAVRQVEGLAADVAPPTPEVPGFELLGELGRGAMGVVYRARQVELNRVVALKMVLAGQYASPTELARFVTEAEAVAKIQHPNVVQIHHAGRHGGAPFFALEYVDGGTLADRVRGGPLPPREAAALVERVARGVAACHARGILHRDLKPGNVLLARDGTPKVADFGLAKRLEAGDGLTASGAVMGTPSFMAPEQARGEVSALGPAADVYGLGAILYCLLTGRPPFQGPSTLDTLVQVQTADPVPPRQLQPGTPRDLETVCLTCLAKDPRRRYATADAAADDLRRWLDGAAVLARPAGPAERAWRWARRNRAAAGAAAAVFLALAAGTAVSLGQAVRATAAEDEKGRQLDRALRAEEEARDGERREAAARRSAEELSRFFREVVAQSSSFDQATTARTADPNLTVKAAMDWAAARLDGRFPDDPLLEADIRFTAGRSYAGLGEYYQAERHLARAADLRAGRLDPDHPDVLAARLALASVRMSRGMYMTAERELTDLMARYDRLGGPDGEMALETRTVLGMVYSNRGRPLDRGEELLREVLAARRRGSDPRRTLDAVAILGQFYAGHTRPNDARPLLEEAYSGRRAVEGERHPRTVESLLDLARYHLDDGDPAQGDVLLTAGLPLAREVLGPRHTLTMRAVRDLAQRRGNQGRVAEMVPLVEEVLAYYRSARGAGHFQTLETVALLAEAEMELGRYADAEGHFRELHAGLAAVGHDGWVRAAARARAGLARAAQGRAADAEADLRAGFDGLTKFADEARNDDPGPLLRRTAEELARAADERGDAAAAARWRAEVAKHPRPLEEVPRPRPTGR